MASGCAWCGAFPAEPVPRWAAGPAVVAMAFFHGGAWLQEEFKSPYCAACRRKVLALSAALTTVVGAGAGLLLFLLVG